MKWGNLLFALGVALVILLITVLLLGHIRRAGAADMPPAVSAAALLTDPKLYRAGP